MDSGVKGVAVPGLLRLVGGQTAVNLLDARGAHHPLWGHSRGQSSANVWPGSAEQLLVRKLKLKPAFEKMRSKWWKNELEQREGLLPRRIAVLSTASNSREIKYRWLSTLCAPQKPPSIVRNKDSVMQNPVHVLSKSSWPWCLHLPFAAGAGVQRRIWVSWSAAGWWWAGIMDTEHN